MKVTTLDEKSIKEILHEKRKTTEYHIKQLQHEGKQGIRYTAMMPDIPFLILGLMSDIGWLTHLIAGIIYFCGNGFRYVLDYAAFLALAGILFGVVYLIYLNKIHEKEIATKLQKNLSFGMTVYSGLAGAVIGILQFLLDAGGSSELVWLTVGGVLYFVAGLAIFLSPKRQPQNTRPIWRRSCCSDSSRTSMWTPAPAWPAQYPELRPAEDSM